MKRLKNERGMSLLEIMIVLSIIGVIAYSLFGDLFTQADSAKSKTTKTQILQLKKKIQLYKMDHTDYPNSWDALIDAGLIEETPMDAWGLEINLEVPGSRGEKFDIWSNGPDEESDTDDDVVSWAKDSDA